MRPEPDLRSFLAALATEAPGSIYAAPGEVPLDYTSTALTLALEKQGRAPVVLLEQLAGREGRLVANLFGTRQMMARSIGATPGTFLNVLGDALDALVPAEVISPASAAPVREIVWEGSDANLDLLPIPRHFEQDAGRYITAGMVAARDPDTGIGNLAYARLQVTGPRRLGVSLHSRQHTWDYLRRAEARGSDLPVAVVIGAHPAVMVAAAAKMGIGEDEYDLAGALIGQPLQLVRGCTVDVMVPATAEIVIEGKLLGNVHENEGPFGEYTGYVTGRSTHNVMEVSAITMRRDAIFVDVVPGNSAEHLILGRAAKEAWVYKRMREALPFFVDFYYPSSGTHFHCYVRIDKSAEGQAQQAAQLLVALDHYVKFVVVVDMDIDPADEATVMWAMATRMQADRDATVLSRSMCNKLDPSSYDGVGAKLLIDATRKPGFEAQPVRLPVEAREFAAHLIECQSETARASMFGGE